MKKFLVPVYCLMTGRVVVESESTEKLIDDIRHNRIDVPFTEDMEVMHDSFGIDQESYIIDMETDEFWGC